MKATELRIGNFILFPVNNNGTGEIEFLETQVDSIVFDNDFKKFLIDDYEDFEMKPIPITEEWLCKFGFVKDRRVWSLPLKEEMHDLPSTIQTWQDNNEFMICRNNTYATSIKCEYVHQFQNLYFALKGEDLILK